MNDMNDFFRKFLIVLVMLMLCFSLSAETTYKVNTDDGVQEVVIPDGYTEKDVLLLIAPAYYNLNRRYETALDDIKTLTSQIDSYVESNKELRDKYSDLLKSYDALTESYDNLVQKQAQLTKIDFMRPIVGGSLSYNPFLGNINVGIDFGAMFLEKINLLTSLSFGFGDSFSLGFGLHANIIV